jgi:hypothetical protein
VTIAFSVVALTKSDGAAATRWRQADETSNALSSPEPTMRVLGLVAALSACSPALDRPWEESDVASYADGVYAGVVAIDLRAFAGPLLIAEDTCTGPVELDVGLSRPEVQGTLLCDVPSIGEVELELLGTVVGLPEVIGSFSTVDDSFAGRWDGGFVDETTFSGVLDGTGRRDGLRVRYQGSFRTAHVAGTGTGR